MASQPSKKWQSKNLATLDLDSGEVTLGLTVHLPPKVRIGDHLAVMQDAALAVALDRDITLTALRVLKYLEAVLDYENAIRIVQKDIATTMGLTNPQVSNAMKILLSKGLIEKINSPSLKSVYRLNPHYGWRGKHGKWEDACKSSAPLRLISGGSVVTHNDSPSA